MSVRDLDLKTAEALLNTLDHICDNAEKHMRAFVGDPDPDLEIDYNHAKREEAEYQLFGPAYRPISDLWGELTAHVARLKKGRK